jgi:hypothetical protein
MDTPNFNSIYNNYGIATGLTSLGSYSVPSLSTIYNSVSNPSTPQGLTAGYITGDLYSANFKQSSMGWRLSYAGILEAVNGIFSGTISASTITGSSITGNTITGGTISGTTITGGIVQTAASGNKRVELISNTGYGYLVWLNSSNSILDFIGNDNTGILSISGTSIGLTGSQIVINGALNIYQSPVGGTITPNNYFTIYLNGTPYKVPCQS